MTAVVLALLRRGDRWFLQRRAPSNPVLPGRWEFPGGKVEAGEAPLDALARELHEETGLVLERADPWPPLPGEVTLHPFEVSGAGDPRTDLAWGWFTAAEMTRLPIPPRNVALIRRMGVEGSPPPGHRPDLIG
jgi:8-oxo-dGTP pyrophosphatase MutT (NUDIX family)